MLKFKKGQTYICTKSPSFWWSEGREYKVLFDFDTDHYVIQSDNGTCWFDFEIDERVHKFKLKENNNKMMNKNEFKEKLKENGVWCTENNTGEEDRYVKIIKVMSLIDQLEELQTSDLIENQPHYKNQGIEPITLIRKNFSKEEFVGFLQGNVLKYMLRYKDKNGVEDLKKAKTYLTWLIEEVKNATI